ncbi:Uncharacterised protein [Bordetella pertussis]|nr:Uncharacterised protein [Bordetella pertussis]CFU02119.1 Uncharacterised protein [Bordetella pertussis]CFW41472.1 Uncharacterised protein [Bordetella pertussis]CRE32411.1 Uncharacterised protein [Bordetella pertussis]
MYSQARALTLAKRPMASPRSRSLSSLANSPKLGMSRPKSAKRTARDGRFCDTTGRKNGMVENAASARPTA